MSDTSQNNQNSDNKNPITVKEEEIDLVKLFSLIGNSFSRLFKFFEKLLKYLFHSLIIILIFIRDNIVKIFIVTMLGASIGFVFDYISPKEYTYDMIIQPNFKSIDQVYEKMEYYNVLVENEDTLKLSELFNITLSSSKSIKGFELLPYETRKDQILAYDSFLKDTDTLTHEYFSFHDFMTDRVSKFDSKTYIYRIISTHPNMELFGDVILSDIENNPTIQKRKRIFKNTLMLDSIAARNSLKDIDSLRSLYKRVTLAEVERQTVPNSSTYVDFSKESESKNNDLELFTISKELNKKLIEIESQKETSEDIVNVITTFNPSGREIKVFFETKMFLLGIIFGGALLSFILLKYLNIYLIEYKNKL